jgi:hypothetical protein
VTAAAPARRSPLAGLLSALDWMTARQHGTRVLAVVRAGYGSVIVAMLLVNAPVRDRIWGDDAAYDWQLYASRALDSGQPGLYLLSSSPLWSDLLYLALIVVAAAFALGFGGRVTAVLFFVLLWSLHARNPIATNGGDNLMRLVLIYLMFARTTAHYSIDAWRARRRRLAGRPLRSPSTLGTVLHNGALVASIAQVCVLYITSGLAKVQGEMWQNGTALYYVLRTADYNVWPEVTAPLYQSPLIVVGATYAAVFVQLMMPVALLDRRAKAILLPMVLGMHLAIGVLMGLPFFSAIMIVSDLLFLSDRDLARGRARIRVLRSRWRQREESPITRTDAPGRVPVEVAG